MKLAGLMFDKVPRYQTSGRYYLLARQMFEIELMLLVAGAYGSKLHALSKS